MRITSSGTKFTVKKPQSKRPKNKPGCKKDFVFVDLSPVKSEEKKDALAAHNESSDMLPPSPVSSIHSDESFGSHSDVSSIFDQRNYTLAEPFKFDQNELSANIEDLINQIPTNYNTKQNLMSNPIIPSTPVQKNTHQFETPVNQILRTPEILRSKSTGMISYDTPDSYKPQLSRSVSEPVNKIGHLDTFMNLNHQFESTFANTQAFDSSFINHQLVDHDDSFTNVDLEIDQNELQEFFSNNLDYINF